MTLPTTITLVSEAEDGTNGNGDSSSRTSISPDGRYVAFDSRSTNLVDGDTNGFGAGPDSINGRDVFLKDLETGEVKRISISAAGEALGGASSEASVSSAGLFVAFQSDAVNLASDDTNGMSDIFVKDVTTGKLVWASTDSDGGQLDWGSYRPDISADGHFVAFESSATNTGLNDSNGSTSDVFLKNMTTGELVLVSRATNGFGGDGNSDGASVSADGHFVAFDSSASNLVADDDNGKSDVFVKDMVSGEITRVSAGDDGQSVNPILSLAGDYVAFDSDRDHPIGIDTGYTDAYVMNLATGELTLVSAAADGTPGNGGSRVGGISADGRYVAFSSEADNLVAGDTNDASDVFVKDLKTGAITRISVGADGAQGNDFGSFAPSISSNGHIVAFQSYSSNLIAGDTNRRPDIFATYVDGGDGPVNGDDGDNILSGTTGSDDLSGGGGFDFIAGGGGGDTLDGGDGFDAVSWFSAKTGITVNLTDQAENGGAAAGDTVSNFEAYYLSNHGDNFTGDDSGAFIYGFGGNDIIKGGAGTDFIDGGAGADKIDAGDGFDYVSWNNSTVGLTIDMNDPSKNTGEAKGDIITNAEAFYLSEHNDVFTGQDLGQNIVFGQAGNDKLTGGATSNDWLFGGKGNDVLTGGVLDDLFSGGEDKDTYVLLDPATNGFDQVLDFVSGQDTIQLSAAGFGLAKSAHLHAGTSFIAAANPQATTGNATLLYATGLGILYFDPDGNGAHEAYALAQFAGAPTIAASDFHVV